MEKRWINEDWEALRSLLPEGWEEKAVELGALAKVRKIQNAGELLRLLLLHVGPGLSLAQTVVRGSHYRPARRRKPVPVSAGTSGSGGR